MIVKFNFMDVIFKYSTRVHVFSCNVVIFMQRSESWSLIIIIINSFFNLSSKFSTCLINNYLSFY